MRTKVKALAAGGIVTLTLLLPFAQAAHAELSVTRAACAGGGGTPGTSMCIGGKFHGLPLSD